MISIDFVLKHILVVPRAAARAAAPVAAHERGQTLAEYSLILTVVAVGVVAISVMFFSSAVAGTFDSVTACFGGSC